MFILYVHHYNRVGPVHTYGGSFRDRACLCFAPTRDHTCESSTLCTYCKKLLLNFLLLESILLRTVHLYSLCIRPTYLLYAPLSRLCQALIRDADHTHAIDTGCATYHTCFLVL